MSDFAGEKRERIRDDGGAALMRVAFVAPYLPAPEDSGGRIRMARLAKALSARARVELFACGGARELRSERGGEALACYSALHVRGRAPSARPWPWVASRVRTATPAALYAELWASHKRRSFDAVVVSHSYAMAMADAARGAPVVLDEHNVESAYASATADAGDARARVERARLIAWERGCWERASAVTCVSAEDAEVVRAGGGRDVTVVGNGVDVGAVRFVAPSERARRPGEEVLFVGMMGFAPNVEGAVFLATEVMPKVWRSRPGARLVLCGRQPSDAVRSLAGPRVEVTGTVTSVQGYLSRARVVAVPLFRGAGSSLKAVEALASGATVVSTPVGMRGIDGARAGHTHWEASDAAAFAERVLAGLGGESDVASDGARDEMARRARAVAERYEWATLGERFAAVVERVGRGRAGA